MNGKILYFGDTALKEAASYLAGVMAYRRLAFDYIPSDSGIQDSMLDRDYQLYIVSDYPSKLFGPRQLAKIAERVSAGAGLLMIGGWESFTGFGGDYGKTVLKDVLPVEMSEGDDRVNCPQPCLVEPISDHEIIADLPFSAVCPGIGGFNRVACKPDALEILSARRFSVSAHERKFVFNPVEKSDPLLVVWTFGQGRVTAFASDAAPHWVGGLVDWGDGRVAACGPGANPVEVGNLYARFFGQMIAWTGRLE